MHGQTTLRGVAALAALAALAVGAPSSAQGQNGTIHGQVLDASSGRPLSNAQILVEGTGIGQLTNAAGRFLLPSVPAGEHVVRAALIGTTRSSSPQATSVGVWTSRSRCGSSRLYM